MEHLTPLVVLHQVFEDAKSIVQFDKEWMDSKEKGTNEPRPYGAVYAEPLLPGEVARCTDRKGRIMVIIGLPEIGNAVLYARGLNSSDEAVLGCFPSKLHSIYRGMLERELPIWLVRTLTGYADRPNIGTLLLNDPTGNSSAFYRSE